MGEQLLFAAIEAFDQLQPAHNCRLLVFAGPFMDQALYERLQGFSNSRIIINRFTPDFLSYLAATDLSLSMAGYNTCMNIMAAGAPALVWPFAQNHEQRLRAERLAQNSALEVLDDKDLVPDRLVKIMSRQLERKSCLSDLSEPIDLDGAAKTAQWIQNAIANSYASQARS